MFNTLNPDSRPRILVLADVENLVRTASPACSEVVQVRQDVYSLLNDFIDAEVMTIVGASHHAAAAVRFGWSEGRHHWRSGCDGADLAILQALDETQVAGRFDAVVFASGDGIFAEAASRVAALGPRVIVVAQPEALSRRLRFAAHEVRVLPTAGSTAAVGGGDVA